MAKKETEREITISNPEAPASPSQTYYIAQLLRKVHGSGYDVRPCNLTKGQASEMIGKLRDGKKIAIPKGAVKWQKKPAEAKPKTNTQSKGKTNSKAKSGRNKNRKAA